MLLFIKIILSFSLLFIVNVFTFSQTKSICVQIPDNDEVKISEFYGNALRNPTIINDKNPCFFIHEKYIGFIRIEYKKKYLDLIVEDSISQISLNFDADSILHAETDSEINKLYSIIKKKYLFYSKKLKQTKNTDEATALKLKRDNILDSVLSIYPNSFFTLSTQLALTDLNNLSPEEILNHIPFNNTKFLHCSIIPSLILKSFGTIGSPDTIQLKKLIANIYSRIIDFEMKTMITEFLIEFFTSTHEDQILSYILKISNHSFCETEVSESAEKKIKQLQLYTAENYLPDVKINSKKLSKLLKKYKNENIVIIIWSEDCPHCKPFLRDLNSIRNKDFCFIGIEISGKDKVSDFPFFDLDLRDKNGNNGELYKNWMIDKTPIVFNIESSLKIKEIPENPYLFFKF